ncbi:membrane protein [Amycolatopsis xylanica]|uniref:Membrane protein n=1 Tax=Amycolatopsis xylanica TaxID=589385 RepID=A0A1H3RZ38_9PSEU|nr:MmpS family transport accessory protein [Amycolatopsis xylanica]SDZ30952.1 membrane protein [Amycolatopsis xylanica]
MGGPAASPPALAPEQRGSLKPLGSALVVLGVVAATIAVAAQFMPDGRHNAGPAPQPPAVEPMVAVARSVTHSVSYELFGEHGARNITYVAQGAAIAQEREAATPWSKKFQRTGVEGGSEFYSVSAQGKKNGKLRCRILVDNQVVSESESIGDQPVTCAR